jgi:hypothetical protein
MAKRQGAPKKKKEDKFSERVIFTITPPQKKALYKSVRESKQNLSDFIRGKVLDE